MSRHCCYDYALVVAIAIAMAIAVALVVVTLVVVTMALTMLFLITWGVLTVVPVVLYKIDPLVARVVFSAMLGPMLAMARGYVQIYWLALVTFLHDYSGLTIVNLRLRKAADVESAIKAGLADADRNPDLSECRGGDGSSGYCRCD